MRQQAPVTGLRRDDVDGGQRTGSHDDRDGGQDERHFVADHLRNGAHGAQQRVLVPARPAGHEHRQLRRRADGEEKQHAAIEVHSGHVPSHRHHRKGQQHRHHQDQRREEMHDLIGGVGHDVLLGQGFQSIGDRLEKAVGPNPVGAVAVLDAPKPLRSNSVVIANRVAKVRMMAATESSAEKRGWHWAGAKPTSQCFKVTRFGPSSQRSPALHLNGIARPSRTRAAH